MSSNSTTVNPDLARDRLNATIDLDQMKLYLGELIYFTKEKYYSMLKYRDDMVKQIRPISEDNFYNLDRDEKYRIIFKKSLELVDYTFGNNIEDLMSLYMVGSVIGPEKFLFNLHYTMFRDAIDVWSTPEQKAYWNTFMNENTVLGSYVQTELGHGTYLRGLETTATYDKRTQEFILDSPTVTATKYWPGGSAKSCNFAIVMAKLIIDGKEYGIHAFVVQMRSLENHKVVPGLEVGDLGKKFGFDATDNGYLRFNKMRVPRFNMLMQFARVSPDGKFERVGSEVLMYSAMLLMRGMLSLVGPFYLSISTTIAIRYSSVRRQTVNAEGIEQQVINYQTQQYRLFPALAATYAMSFTGWTFRKMLIKIQSETNRFKDIDLVELGKLHALTSGLKAVVFGDCLRFAQSNRLCCGGHGYSASSGLSQIIQETDAGCSYEGDNVVLLLQTARYLLKCTQKGISPHLELPNSEQLRSSDLYKQFDKYFQVFYRLYDESVNDITSKLFKLVKENGMAELDGWNRCSQQLINAARVFIDIFIINCNLLCVYDNPVRANQKALGELLELYILYQICEIYPREVLQFNVIDSNTMGEYRERLFELLPLIRINAVALVDSFDMLDSNLCSSLGAYDGNVYERLLDFSRKSLLNQKEVHDVYELYLKPFAIRNKHKARL